VTAVNLEDQSGVAFVIRLPLVVSFSKPSSMDSDRALRAER
jgi:hypothetical protein